MSEQADKIKSAIKLYAVYAVIAAMIIVYTLIGTVGIARKQATLRGIIEDMLLPYIFGVCITSLFVEQGLGMGDGEECVIKAVKVHEEAAERVAPRVEELEDWCREETRRALAREKRRVLADEGMVYSDYYDEEGRLIGCFEPQYKRIKGRGRLSALAWNRQERRREKAFFKATRLRIKPLEAGELLSEGHVIGKPFDLGRSEAQYRKEKAGKSLITKPVTSIIIGYYAFEQLNEFDAARLLGQVFGAVTFVAFGVVAMSQALSYKKSEYAGRMTRKAAFLMQFERDTQKAEEKNDTEEQAYERDKEAA